MIDNTIKRALKEFKKALMSKDKEVLEVPKKFKRVKEDSRRISIERFKVFKRLLKKTHIFP